jgi:hypothetical protein
MPGHLETRGMLLSDSFESNLSHISTLYYHIRWTTKIFEYCMQGVSKNKKEFQRTKIIP